MPGEDNVMSQRLADFFHEKVVNIQSVISRRLGGSVPDPMKADTANHGIPLDNLMTVTEAEVQKILSLMNGKTSPRDSIPTTLMKECSSTFSSIIARLVKLSFSEGVFPFAFKCAQITPIMKKAGLEPSVLTNYRPISNLSTISKILERLYLSRLKPQVSPLCSPLRSAYRLHHSTETALIGIVNDMFEAADAGCATVLLALDLSAAFDTIEHAVILRRLSDTLGVTGTALNWIKSYLTARTSFVRIGSISSSKFSLDTGDPQGSVLGPLLFTLFTTPLCDIITRFGLRFNQYADDTQIYIAIRRDIIACVTSNPCCMHGRRLRLVTS